MTAANFCKKYKGIADHAVARAIEGLQDDGIQVAEASYSKRYEGTVFDFEARLIQFDDGSLALYVYGINEDEEDNLADTQYLGQLRDLAELNSIDLLSRGAIAGLKAVLSAKASVEAAALPHVKAKLNITFEYPAMQKFGIIQTPKVGTIEFKATDDTYIDKGRLGGVVTIDGVKYEGYFEYNEQSGIGWRIDGKGNKIVNAINDYAFSTELPAWDDKFLGKIATYISKHSGLDSD